MNELDSLTIDTPENVAFGYQIAGIGSRFLAALADTLLIAILLVVVNLVVSWILDTVAAPGALTSWVVGMFALLDFAIIWGYYIFFELAWNGQSPGKRKVGLRVVCQPGTPVTLTESLIRNLVRLVDFLPFAYGIGLVAMFIDGKARRLGDLAASTLVVYDRGEIVLLRHDVQPSLVSSTWSMPERLEGLPLQQLTERDIQAVEEYFRRRYQITDSQALGRSLLAMLYRRMNAPLPDVPDSELNSLLSDIVRARRSGRTASQETAPDGR